MSKLPKDDEAFACNVDVAQALDFFSYRSNTDSFDPFNMEVQFIRGDQKVECEYCTKPARWRLKELND